MRSSGTRVVITDHFFPSIERQTRMLESIGATVVQVKTAQAAIDALEGRVPRSMVNPEVYR